METKVFDVLVIGAGPAGLTAGIYLTRAGKKAAVFERFTPGGQVALTGEVENYLGYGKISGFELAQNFASSATSVGVNIINEEVVAVDFSKKLKKIKTRNNTYTCKAAIIATGCKVRELNIEGEQQFKGRGVSYCATCDGNFFKGKTIAVIGSGDSAVGDALYLSGICKQVYLLTKSYLKVKNYSIEQVKRVKNIKILSDAISAKIEGKDKVEGLVYTQNNKQTRLKVEGVFVAIGRLPDNEIFKDQLQLAPNGYVATTDGCATSCPGVFACGDIVDGSLRQIVYATGDGAKAATSAIKYIATNR